MKKIVTMSDIAKTLGVSTVTVSKALADKEGVSDEIRAKIKQVANEMGYRYNVAAKSLKDGLTYNVGIIIAERFIEVGVSFYWQLYKRLADELMKINYYAVFEILKPSEEQTATEPKMVIDKKVDGIIVLGQVGKEYFNMIKAASVPAVFIDFYENDSTQDFIITDNFYSMYMLTNYLIEMGHRDIGFVGNIRATSSIQDRYLGYLKSLIENDIDLDRCKQWYISDRDDESGHVDFELKANLPTAFVCNCDNVAYELIRKLSEKGYRVPDDISVVGFDNYSVTANESVRLTTAEVDMKAMAHTAIDVLMKRINNVKAKRGIKQVSCKIIIRDSVKRLK
ncbi:LacI family DNA-binding transcriptional regulator [Clostridium thermarum]|uniref:LacI family DNA-binding transcriptional regulator n=1 Tax=Clostridium thermarum TaxID=1716543 RepID=UPI0013D82931|nr:LacI family DNA-binding transcriptional regulator [Clostridium thermarum]